ncbi:hypothetical protein RFI_27230 [Reticulomyxa filosa]|uniref:Uncharacterized protein n=1 Tax=Reticulomyxa filosa TaxID=46433 RepID=X6M9J4_RETFI|nr:hypothetical protein RFI_27230 [Reticulomyxa filosa]|eukprot:ETO10147.1 hypothetical protein RFI_27230 [Reticulomyxa filosa]
MHIEQIALSHKLIGWKTLKLQQQYELIVGIWNCIDDIACIKCGRGGVKREYKKFKWERNKRTNIFGQSQYDHIDDIMESLFQQRGETENMEMCAMCKSLQQHNSYISGANFKQGASTIRKRTYTSSPRQVYVQHNAVQGEFIYQNEGHEYVPNFEYIIDILCIDIQIINVQVQNSCIKI